MRRPGRNYEVAIKAKVAALKGKQTLVELAEKYDVRRSKSAADAADRRAALELSFAGARMLRDMLKLEGMVVGRKHIGTLMAKMCHGSRNNPQLGSLKIPHLPL